MPPSRLMYFSMEISSLEKFGFSKKVPGNSIFIKPGDIPSHCYIVKKGGVIGFEYASNGDERVYNIMLSGSFLLEMNLILKEPSPVYFKTIKPSELICIDRNTLLSQMGGDFDFSLSIIKSISYKYLAAMEQIREMNNGANWRFCRLLLLFAGRYGVPHEGKIMIKEKISQQIVSDLLGVNRITVNRIIKTLKNEGLLSQINGYYCISDEKKLRQYMNVMNVTDV
jgi:CRP/FNR family transcriptional regulator